MCVCVCCVRCGESRVCRSDDRWEGTRRFACTFQASDVTRELEAENARRGEEGRKWMVENGSTQK